MIEKVMLCQSCGGEYKVAQYCTITKCPYCGVEREFEGFKYKKIDYSRSNWSWVEKLTDCPKCMSPNMIYSDEKDCFVCLDCEYEITEEWLRRSVLWFCDKCDAYMNTMRGFTQAKDTYVCQNCGFENDITENNII